MIATRPSGTICSSFLKGVFLLIVFRPCSVSSLFSACARLPSGVLLLTFVEVFLCLCVVLRHDERRDQ
ncbi:hypothetical protein CSUI_004260 [Cystoisospora suis]|uniref:Transmembrane protein n=1 Tax=Cystoisospora suis TaxID=483139 RepID=A0A2C6KCD5_9APIC|nr:hypothetical protein CSUI_004260 [Cystoisospora suis]